VKNNTGRRYHRITQEGGTTELNAKCAVEANLMQSKQNVLDKLKNGRIHRISKAALCKAVVDG
jgi:hypothetical protein